MIIPTYNRASYLQEAIRSVLVQTYPDFEIIVVDDGSVDATASVVAGFGDTRIRYLYQNNAGRSVARNKGLALACGEYVAFLDDDDLYLPHKLATQAAFLDQHKDIGLVAGGARIISEDGTVIRERQSWKEQPQLSLPACLYACPLLTCTVLFRQQWLAQLDHWFDAAMDRAEDTDFWIRLLLAGCQMAWLQDIVSAYRWHKSNSQQDDDRYYRSFLYLFDKLFSRSDLPVSVRNQQAYLYVIRHTQGACQAYAVGEIAEAQRRLMKTTEWTMVTTKDFYSTIARSIAAFARTDQISDPQAFIKLVFEHLPDALVPLKAFQNHTWTSFYMMQVFKAQQEGRHPRLVDWLLGVCHDPTWLRNRGVWSILLRDILLSKVRE